MLKVTQQLHWSCHATTQFSYISFSVPWFVFPQLPLGKIGRGFSSKEPDFHDDYGSLENEDCGDEDLQGRPEQCRLEGYGSLEVTNV